MARRQNKGGSRKKGSKTAKHSPSDVMQRFRTEANKAKRKAQAKAQAKAQVPKQRRIRTPESYREAYYEKQRAAVVRNTEVLYPNGNPKIMQLVAAWKSKHNTR